MKNLQLQLSIRNSDIVGHIPNFLSEDEVHQVKELNSSREWKMAGTKWSQGDLSVRYSKKLNQINFPFYDRLYDAVSLYNKKSYNLHIYPNRNQHEINWVRYDKKGMFFTAHRDHRPCLSNFLNKEYTIKVINNKPVLLSTIVSIDPPILLATIGFFIDCASTDILPKASGSIDAETTTFETL